MRSPGMKLLVLSVLVACLLAVPAVSPAASDSELVIGHPACLSGNYAKAGEQVLGGVKACVAWVNDVHGGVMVGGKKLPLEYKYYDCESKKENVTSLIERLITVDKVNVVFSSYSSGLTILLVEQNAAASPEATDRVYIMHEGRIKASGTAAEISDSPVIREAYLGL